MQDSFYAPLAKEFQDHVQRVPGRLSPPLALPSNGITFASQSLTNATQIKDTTPREIYASKVVPATLKPSPPAWYWVGATTGIVRFVDIFGFRTFWVSLFIHFMIGKVLLFP